MIDPNDKNDSDDQVTKNGTPSPDQAQLNWWKKRSEDDVTYQRQAQLTWWTLMGGIALGALLTQFESLLAETRMGNWHFFLYFFATCFVIINSWVQTAWGALVLCWPISVGSSLILFFNNLSCAIAALSITNPRRWMIGVAGVVLFAVLMQFYFKSKQGWIAFSPDGIQRAERGIVIYIGLFLLLLVMVALLTLFPSRWLEILFGVLALRISSLALYWQNLAMQQEKADLNMD
jgi:membrane-associated HD superfamily phosphohydrolase